MQDLPHSPLSLNSPSVKRKASEIVQVGREDQERACVRQYWNVHKVTPPPSDGENKLLLPQRSFQREFCYPVTTPGSRAEAQPRETPVLFRQQQNYSKRRKRQGLKKRPPTEPPAQILVLPQQKFQYAGADWCLQECHSMWVNADHGWWYLLHELIPENRTGIMTCPFPRD